MKLKFPTVQFYLLMAFALLVAGVCYFSSMKQNPFVETVKTGIVKTYPILEKSTIPDSMSFRSIGNEEQIDTIQYLRQSYWLALANSYKDSAVNKSTIKSFCRKIMLIDSAGYFWKMNLAKRKSVKNRIMAVCLAETTHGKYGIALSMNNVTGKKIHGDFFKWFAVSGYLQYAEFKHWTHSILFLAEKILASRGLNYHEASDEYGKSYWEYEALDSSNEPTAIKFNRVLKRKKASE